jgi:hypothetical protein
MSANGSEESVKSFKEIKRNKLYLIERETHDKYCDGEGKILKFNIFSGQRLDEDCAFCKRMTSYRLRKHLERTETYGEKDTSNTDVGDEDQEADEGL